MSSPADGPVPARYAVLVPVKPPAIAKSRLAPLGDDARRDLAAAFAADTVAAVLSCEVVDRALVVTDDHVLARTMSDLGADVIPDGTSDLNGTLVQAAAEMHRRDPGLRLAVVCADLPALRAAELGVGAGGGVARRHVVRHRPRRASARPSSPHRTSTRSGRRSGPAPGSSTSRRVRTRSTGSTCPRVRRDVDDPADLDEALALGVGPRTSLVATALHRRPTS